MPDKPILICLEDVIDDVMFIRKHIRITGENIQFDHAENETACLNSDNSKMNDVPPSDYEIKYKLCKLTIALQRINREAEIQKALIIAGMDS